MPRLNSTPPISPVQSTSSLLDLNQMSDGEKTFFIIVDYRRPHLADVAIVRSMPLDPDDNRQRYRQILAIPLVRTIWEEKKSQLIESLVASAENILSPEMAPDIHKRLTDEATACFEEWRENEIIREMETNDISALISMEKSYRDLFLSRTKLSAEDMASLRQSVDELQEKMTHQHVDGMRNPQPSAQQLISLTVPGLLSVPSHEGNLSGNTPMSESSLFCESPSPHKGQRCGLSPLIALFLILTPAGCMGVLTFCHIVSPIFCILALIIYALFSAGLVMREMYTNQEGQRKGKERNTASYGKRLLI